ncbi:hypothetical protein [Acidovorax sp. BLS4]|uniref:hypothetical protein n=1 Tax=Acidovorax sp. BLS4 TaxID=3273430 RepID=UPI0029431921|nr:hypothetical protein [Paracidovorax avenae]WOI44902.1 hypothetical protein R1Z03_20630 [Paracidovorax avenae]
MGFLLFLIVCALTVLAWLAAIGSAIPYGGGGMGLFLIAVAMTILVIGWVGVWIIGGIWGAFTESPVSQQPEIPPLAVEENRRKNID